MFNRLFKKLLNKVKSLNFKDWIWITLLFLLFIWLCPVLIDRFIRLINSIVMFVENIIVYVLFVFAGIDPDGIKTSLPFIDLSISIWDIILPINPQFFLVQLSNFFTLPFNSLVFQLYFNNLINTLLLLSRLILIGVMIAILIRMLLVNYYSYHEFDPKEIGKESKVKKIFLKVVSFLKKIIINPLIKFYNFSKDKVYWKVAVLIILFRLKVISLGIETLSFLFAFVVSFNFIALYEQVISIIYDLLPVLKFIPLVVWIGLFIFLKCRSWIMQAEDEVRHQQLILKTIVKAEMTTTNFFVGPPGVGKDLLMTECTIIAESNLRYDLRKVLFDIRSEFPEFNFVEFEQFLQYLISERIVVNWRQLEKFVHDYLYELIDYGETSIFGYKIFNYSLSINVDPFMIHQDYYYIYSDKLYRVDDKGSVSLDITIDSTSKTKKAYHYNELTNEFIIDALSEYAHAYFMYIQETVLAASNYAIRFDNIKIDYGHFVEWDDDFLSHDNRNMKDFSSYSHINNYDWQRVYKKLDNNEFASLEDGCILALTEYAKERLNQTELRSMKADSSETNQLNDGTNIWWKTKSHENTIRNKRYGQAFVNDQRDQSMNADNRETFENTWEIKSKTEERLLLPGFWYSLMILDLAASFTRNQVERLSDVRSDDSLLFFIFKKLNSFFYSLQQKINNRYGIHHLTLSNQYGKTINVPVIHKLAYADRYTSGALGSMYIKQFELNEVGFNETPTYSSSLATKEELEQQNSYFIDRFFEKVTPAEEEMDTSEIEFYSLYYIDTGSGIEITKKTSKRKKQTLDTFNF